MSNQPVTAPVPQRPFEIGGTCPHQTPAKVFACLLAEHVLRDIEATRRPSRDQYAEWVEWAVYSDRLIEAFQLRIPAGALRAHILRRLAEKEVA
jgi:hypothetical protein